MPQAQPFSTDSRRRDSQTFPRGAPPQRQCVLHGSDVSLPSLPM